VEKMSPAYYEKELFFQQCAVCKELNGILIDMYIMRICHVVKREPSHSSYIGGVHGANDDKF
jgi:hypothetical protein